MAMITDPNQQAQQLYQSFQQQGVNLQAPNINTPSVTPTDVVQAGTQTVTPKAATPTQAKTQQEVDAIRQQITQNQQASGGDIYYDPNTGAWRNRATQQPIQGTPENLDPVIQSAKQNFAKAQQSNNLASMIEYAKQADDRRVELGLQAINTDYIKRLEQELSTKQPVVQPGTQAGTAGTQSGTGQFKKPGTPVTTTDAQGNQVFADPGYEVYRGQYEAQIKSMIDEIANQPPWESPYASILQDMINKIATREFDYDPATDPEFQRDSKILSQMVMEQTNDRGILNSSITTDRIQSTIKDLMVDYSAMAYDRFMQDGDALLKQANFIMGVDAEDYSRYMDEQNKKRDLLSFVMKLDENQYSRYQDAMNTDYKIRIQEYNSIIDSIQIERNKISDTWDRVDRLGYIDNDAALILGLDPGQVEDYHEMLVKQKITALEAEESKQAFELTKIKETYKGQIAVAKEREQIQIREESRAKIAAENARIIAASQPKTYSATDIRTLPPTSLGDEAQASNYATLKSEIFNMAGGNANKALENIMTNPALESQLGNALYQRMIYDFKELADVQKNMGGDGLSINTYLSQAKAQKEATLPQTDFEAIDSLPQRTYTNEQIIDNILTYPISSEEQLSIITALFSVEERNAYWKAKEQEYQDSQRKAPPSRINR